MFRKLCSFALMLAVAVLASGCNSDTTKTTDTKKIETPSGTKTITTEQKVETSGSNPPGGTSGS
jgi:hypothetical protein